ncbi:MAG: hypothetical protein AAF840_15465 [Bacteroidota bacterium]
MLKKTPPYKLIGWAGSFILMLAVGYFYQFQGGKVSSFWMGFMSAVSFAVLLMVVLEIWQLTTDFQQGFLFPMRNATFFLTILSIVALPLIGVYATVTGQALEPSTLLLLPVFLFLLVRNLFRIRIDLVSLEAKTGFRAATYVPLFDIKEVKETEQGLTIETADGKSIRLLRAFFFPGIWKKLTERLNKL